MYRRITKLIQLLIRQHLSYNWKLLMMDVWHSLQGKEINSIAFICPGALGKSTHFPVCTNLLFKIILYRLFFSQIQITLKIKKKTFLFFFHKRNEGRFTLAWNWSSGMKNTHFSLHHGWLVCKSTISIYTASSRSVLRVT